MKQEKMRNVAIIAHVDHGKTTLVDEMLKQGGIFRDNQQVEDRVMDSNALERERGITILAKNTSVMYNGTKINIVDTPGHADFSGEVERILKMVDGVLLLVDAFEGAMPQTRFVLQKALELNHKVIVVVNKIDKPDARPLEVVDEVLELLLDLDATEEQLDSPVLFCSGRKGTASLSPDTEGTDLVPLFETILSHIDCPEGELDAPMQTLISAIDYNDYVGRIGIGRIERGKIREGSEIYVSNILKPDESYKAKLNNLYVIEGLNRVPVKEAEMGEIVCFSGIENISIGDTICSPEDTTPLPFVKISEPTVEMLFCVNDSPFAGREGKFVTSRQIADRLFKELLKDVSLRVERTETTDSFKVMGRGEMHLSILIETMRREGYEFAVTPPQVLYKTIDGVKCEPMEKVLIDTPDEFVGTIIEKLSQRKGTLLNMHPQGSRTRIEFLIPVRGLFGYRNEFLTDTKGEGIMNTQFEGYEAYKGDIQRRSYGSLIAFETGTAVTYGLFNAQERGTLFIDAGVEVYEGMIVGQNPKGDDMAVNVCKKKHITNTRASGSDDALRLIPPRRMSLEQCIEFLSEDELLEVTPKTLRLRKRILSNTQRMKNAFKK
ncbi:MAG: translational GTPase TypA [Oscillospiraceae bacterium]|nr:translational GTPase TypA [Oscillospiraceae bacterium]